MRITVKENGKPVARFDSVDDAQAFAEFATTNTTRVLEVSDRAGWVTLSYQNGIKTSY